MTEVLRDDSDRPEHQAVVHRGLLRCRGPAESEAADRRARVADAEFAQNACEGARDNAKKHGFKVVYDKSYPPATTDFTPIVRAVQAANPDLFVVCSYPLDSVGMVKAVNEIGFKPKMIGGAMVGLQATVFKNQLGPLLNGWVNYETWVPSEKLNSGVTEEFFKKYQARAAAAGVDPLGYYLGGWGYAYIELLGKAIEGVQEPRRRQDRRLHAQDHVQDHHGRHQVRQERRMGEGPACCRCSITASSRAPASIRGGA